MNEMEMAGTGPVLVAGLPVDGESCFTNAKGQSKRSIERRARKILDKTAPVLGAVLEEGEVIRYVAPASSPYSLLELLTTGWVLQTVKRCVLVVTDRRLLHLPVRANLAPRLSVSQVRFADLDGADVAGWLSPALKLDYRRGEKESFRGLPAGARKKLAGLLEGVVGQGTPTARGRRHYLCLRCGHALPDGMERCGSCGLKFKHRDRARWLSILVPGGGYFYTGHPVLGLFDGLFEGILILMLGTSVFFAATGDPEIGLGDVGLWAAILAIEKIVTIYHAEHYVRDFLPAEKGFTPGEDPERAVEPG